MSINMHMYPFLKQTISKEEGGISEYSCQLCASDKLFWSPVPIYCLSCGARIKRGVTYYSTTDENDLEMVFCTLCYKNSRGGNIKFQGISVSKAVLNKTKNDEATEESVSYVIMCFDF